MKYILQGVCKEDLGLLVNVDFLARRSHTILFLEQTLLLFRGQLLQFMLWCLLCYFE